MEVFGAASPEAKPRTYHGLKVFTLEQANNSLPLVSRIMSDVVRLDKQVSTFEESSTARDGATRGDGQSPEWLAYEAALEELSNLRDELSAIGCRLKDWRRGIVDFLGVHNGRLVEYCWRLGEPEISHWHDIGAGFRGREPLSVTPEAEPR